MTHPRLRWVLKGKMHRIQSHRQAGPCTGWSPARDSGQQWRLSLSVWTVTSSRTTQSWFHRCQSRPPCSIVTRTTCCWKLENVSQSDFRRSREKDMDTALEMCSAELYLFTTTNVCSVHFTWFHLKGAFWLENTKGIKQEIFVEQKYNSLKVSGNKFWHLWDNQTVCFLQCRA